MDRPILKSKSRRKLNKTQIIEILERNAAIYRDEENFVHYLVELAVYLMENEYDWPEGSGGAPPQKTETPVNDTPTEHREKLVFARVSNHTPVPARKVCPYCGAEVGDVLICPTCRNLTK